MMVGFAPRPTSGAAEGILRRVFGRLASPLGFRLWDGTEVRVGQGEPRCTVVIHSPEAFRSLMREPSPAHFAEAYVDSAIDIEGDLFAAMDVANELEALDLSLAERLRILAALGRP
ncbi:MAG: hypothetical protein AAB265_10860 [candidate division NC10 bacterium]